MADRTIAAQVTLLSRSQIIERLRSHVADRGFVTMASLVKHDKPAFRSVLVHFDSLAAARKAAGLPAHRQASNWSKARVLDEIRRLDRSGASMKARDLIAAGHADLLRAAKEHAGGMRRARELAGVAAPKAVRYEPWDKLRVLATIIELRRKRCSLAQSRVPPPLVSAGVKFYGSWPAAVEASRADYEQERLRRAPYTAAEVIDMLRKLARTRPAMTPVELYEHGGVSAMRRLFGSVDRAIAAAGIENWPKRKNQWWDRESVIRELRARAKQHVLTLTGKLHNACVVYFGNVNAAREAAGVPQLLRAPWTKDELLAELRARADRGDFGSDLKAAARRLFGSIANARRLAGVAGPVRWTRQRVIAELREFMRSGKQTLTGSLSGACKEYFGSVKAACRAARVPWPLRPLLGTWSKPKLLEELRRRVAAGQSLGSLPALCRKKFGSMHAARRAAGLPDRTQILEAKWSARQAEADARYPWRRWSREVIKRMLRAWSVRRGPMPRDLELASAHRFGSLSRACAAANIAMTEQSWTPQRTKSALREAARDGGPLPKSLINACCRQFGSVEAARVAAKLPLPGKPRSR